VSRRHVAALAGMLPMCANSNGRVVDPVRFEPRPVLTQLVPDDVPTAPRELPFRQNLYGARKVVIEPVEDALDFDTVGPALDVNALGEVPDSGWFENRSRRGMLPSVVARGPSHVRPSRASPWIVESSKRSGVAAGFIFRDADGRRFLLKFDARDAPEIETAGHIVTHRLLWAAGYHVPNDHVVFFESGDVELASDAVEEGRFGEREFERDRLEAMFESAPRAPDGRLRALVSEFVPGTPLGGFAARGVREDDPNDLVPHERRRVLRGLYVFAAWLDHVDLDPSNTLDAWVEDPKNPGRHFVRHYLIDFGKALGGLARIDRRPQAGYGYLIDFAMMPGSLFSLGIIAKSMR